MTGIRFIELVNLFLHLTKILLKLNILISLYLLYYILGFDGLNELLTICPDLFSPFVNTILFSEHAKHFERSVEDAETNKKVDEVIEKFLITLSPYMMLKASLKCLEWLVHRYDLK